MSPPDPERVIALRAVIAGFLDQRQAVKAEKIDKLDLPEEVLAAQRAELQAQFVASTWLEDAARRVAQIQAVTHSLKPIHPDAKGSSLFCEPTAMPEWPVVGSHLLPEDFDADVVGNAAALDVYKFLKLEHGGHSLLNLAANADADLAAALSDDVEQAQGWMAAFASLATPRGRLSSHTLAKQVYWPVGSNPHDDQDFHLLAPLFPTSLVHRVYQTVQAHRFGDEAKAAREARKAGHWCADPVRDYPQLAIRKLGGTKPQNISQLNSERRGDNLLLASLPPVWQVTSTKPILGVQSLFDVFRWRAEVKRLTGQLRQFLESDPAHNLATRTHRDELVESLLDELMQFTAELQELEPGWSQQPDCELGLNHQRWLDPDGAPASAVDLVDALASDFANWLNHQLRTPLPMGDAEYLHWRQQARELFKQAEREGAL